jgi:hypothetical protein
MQLQTHGPLSNSFDLMTCTVYSEYAKLPSTVLTSEFEISPQEGFWICLDPN